MRSRPRVPLLRRRGRRTRPPDISQVAAVVQRLAVLMSAGVAPAAAWGYLREGELAHEVAIAASRGQQIPEAIVAVITAAGGEGRGVEARGGEAHAWRGVATAWAVASDAGAPLAPTLRDFARSLRDLAQVQREISVALAAPAATARLVMALPFVGMLFGLVLGFNTFGTLFTTPVGWACLAAGAALMLGASRWNRRLVRSAQPRDLTPGLEFDLVAIAVSGGSGIDRARASVAGALTRYSLQQPADHDALDAVLDLSQRAGVPAAELLRSEATECRRSARAEVQERAQALAVRLMLPLGVCVLPAFMVLGVVPLLVTVVESTRVGW